MKNDDKPYQLLKARQVAEELNVSRAMAYRLIQTGHIRSVRINGARRVRPMDLKRYIEKNLTKSEIHS